MNKFEKKRLAAKKVLRDESKSAGGNYDIMVFKDYGKFRRIINALNELKIFWGEVNGEIYVNRHEVDNLLTY